MLFLSVVLGCSVSSQDGIFSLVLEVVKYLTIHEYCYNIYSVEVWQDLLTSSKPRFKVINNGYQFK